MIEPAQRQAVVPRARTAGAPVGKASVPTLTRVPEPVVERVPPLRRLAGLCAWAAILGFLGLVVGVRGMIAILVRAPDWYQPTLIALGLVGIGLIVLAFLTVNLRYIPWLSLTLSTGVLVTSIVVTGDATA
ncbi:MAG TPA: hypothetical protein VJT31_41130 [Rugosimonospora sp.]|nr:hypothetical protein [Rugosimonospora sp.]